MQPDSSTVELNSVEKQNEQFDNLNKKLEVLHSELAQSMVKTKDERSEEQQQFAQLGKQLQATRKAIDDLQNNSISKSTVINVIESEKNSIMSGVNVIEQRQASLESQLNELATAQNNGFIQLQRRQAELIDVNLMGSLRGMFREEMTKMEQVFELKMQQRHEEMKGEMMRENQAQTSKLKEAFIAMLRKQDKAIMDHVTHCTRTRSSSSSTAPLNQKRPSQDHAPMAKVEAKVARLDVPIESIAATPMQPIEDIVIEARPDQDHLVLSPLLKPKVEQQQQQQLRDPRRIAREFEQVNSLNYAERNQLNEINAINARALSDQHQPRESSLTPPPASPISPWQNMGSPKPVPPPGAPGSTSSLLSPEPPITPDQPNFSRWPSTSTYPPRRSLSPRSRTPSPSRRPFHPGGGRGQGGGRKASSRSRSRSRSSSRDRGRPNSRSSSRSGTPQLRSKSGVRVNDSRRSSSNSAQGGGGDEQQCANEWRRMCESAPYHDKVYRLREENGSKFIGCQATGFVNFNLY